MNIDDEEKKLLEQIIYGDKEIMKSIKHVERIQRAKTAALMVTSSFFMLLLIVLYRLI